MRAVRVLAVTVALLALCALARGHAAVSTVSHRAITPLGSIDRVGQAGAALRRAGRLTPPPAPCPAGVPVQTLTVVNEAHVRPWALAEVERAMAAQSLQLRASWGTPCVWFGPGGSIVYLQTGYTPDPDGGHEMQLGGEHFGTGVPGYYWHGQPYAIVDTGGLGYARWSFAFSHEVAEMLVDPEDDRYWQLGGVEGLLEVCDPVQRVTYLLDGVQVSDFVLPSYFTGGPGPWDHLGTLASPITS